MGGRAHDVEGVLAPAPVRSQRSLTPAASATARASEPPQGQSLLDAYLLNRPVIEVRCSGPKPATASYTARAAARGSDSGGSVEVCARSSPPKGKTGAYCIPCPAPISAGETSESPGMGPVL